MNDPKKPDVKEGVAPNAQQFVPKAGAVLVEGQRASTSEATRRVVDFNESCETLNGVTILLVDDNESLLTTGRAILESLSYKVLTASNGQEAIAVYQANKDTVALILTDVVMPVMGGVDAVKKIRESAPDVKVIFTTGYDRNHMRKADHMDDEDMISKPFKLDELSLLLRAKLER